jgi:hypothetical protein
LFGESRTLAQLQHTHIVPIYSVHQSVADRWPGRSEVVGSRRSRPDGRRWPSGPSARSHHSTPMPDTIRDDLSEAHPDGSIPNDTSLGWRRESATSIDERAGPPLRRLARPHSHPHEHRDRPTGFRPRSYLGR